jgi:hypothetical protein
MTPRHSIHDTTHASFSTPGQLSPEPPQPDADPPEFLVSAIGLPMAAHRRTSQLRLAAGLPVPGIAAG